MTRAAKKIFSYLIKVAIVILAFTFIYRKVNNNANLTQFRRIVEELNRTQVVFVLSLIVLMMLLNWFLESLKWRYITRVLSPITVYQAVESVFCGLTWAIFTPNRLGEYGGRVMFLPPRKRIHGVFSMAVGSFGQMVITNVLGIVALLWFCYTFLHLQIWMYLAAVCSGTLVISLLLIFYFNISWLVSVLNSVKFLKQYHRFFEIMNRYRVAELDRIMLFSLARFAVFTFQYYLILHLLVPEMPVLPMVMMVLILFFVQSILPSLDLLDVGVRGATATMFFAYITNQQVAVIAAVSSIWFINLIVPAILGSIFVFKMKFF